MKGAKRIKSTGRGFDYYGPCEVCGNRCDQHYKRQVGLSQGWLTKAWGHLKCLKTGEWADVTVEHNAN